MVKRNRNSLAAEIKARKREKDALAKHDGKAAIENLATLRAKVIDLKAKKSVGPVQTRSRPGPDPVQTRSRPGPNTKKSSVGPVQTGSKQIESVGPVQTRSRLCPESTKDILAEKQQIVFDWLFKNESIGVMNKVLIQKDTQLSQTTIKRSIIKIKSLGLISTGNYSPVTKVTKYKISTVDPIEITKQSFSQNQPIKKKSGPGLDPDVPPSNKIDRQTTFNFNLSFCLSDFWVAEGLTKQKVSKWMKEFEYTEEQMERWLLFAENEPKSLDASKGPMSYLYGCLVKGGIKRPAGFQTPQERRINLLKEENDKAQRAMEQLKTEESRKKEMDITIKTAGIIDNPIALAKILDEIREENKNRPNIMKYFKDYDQYKILPEKLKGLILFSVRRKFS